MNNSAKLSEARKAQIEMAKREFGRRHLKNFISYTYGEKYKFGWVHRIMCAGLDRFLAAVKDGLSPRLAIFMPPRHGKSEIASRRFPAFALGKNPDISIIGTSYSASLASRMNRDVQRIIDGEAYKKLFPQTALSRSNIRTISGIALRNSDIFEIVNHAGSYRAAGVGGGITGMGADILIIDDPVKDRAEAESDVYREKVYDWYMSTAYTRLSPGGGVLLIMTRWHTDDLAGRVLKASDDWKIISYPAIAEVDEKHRKAGEALHPERYSLKHLQKIRAILPSHEWSCLFQQTPIIRGGNMLNTEAIVRHKSISEYPKNLKWYRVWDLAHTAKERAKQDPDYTSGTLLAFSVQDDAMHLWIKNVNRMRKNAPERDAEIYTVSRLDGAYVKIGVGGSVDSKDAIATMRKILKGKRTVYSVSENKDKVVRATPLEPVFKAGNVHVPLGAPWLDDWISEINAFPFGAHDDQVDNLSSGYSLFMQQGDTSSLYEW